MGRSSDMIKLIYERQSGYPQPTKIEYSHLYLKIKMHPLKTLDKAATDYSKKVPIVHQRDYIEEYLNEMHWRRVKYGPFFMAYHYGILM